MQIVMTRAISLLCLSYLCSLGAMEVGKDPLLDKAVADQFPRAVRPMVYAVLTTMERETRALADGPPITVDVKLTDRARLWRRLVISGEISIAEISEENERSKLTPAQRDAEQAKFFERMREQLKRGSEAKP